MAHSSESTANKAKNAIKYEITSANTVAAKPKDESAVKSSTIPVGRPSTKVQDKSIAADQPNDLLTEYLVVNSWSPDDALVNQERHTLYYYAGEEALFGTAQTYLTGIENRYIMDWQNPSAVTDTYTQTYSTGYSCTTSQEMDASLSLAPSFEGISVGNASIGYKSFDSVETSSISTQSVEISIPPRSNVYFYQRRYHFRTWVYFTLDAWADTWIAGSNGGYHVQWGCVDSHIDAQDYLTTDHQLSGTVQTSFDSQAADGWFGDYVRQFGNLTALARETLESIGIDGSQQ